MVQFPLPAGRNFRPTNKATGKGAQQSGGQPRMLPTPPPIQPPRSTVAYPRGSEEPLEIELDESLHLEEDEMNESGCVMETIQLEAQCTTTGVGGRAGYIPPPPPPQPTRAGTVSQAVHLSYLRPRGSGSADSEDFEPDGDEPLDFQGAGTSTSPSYLVLTTHSLPSVDTTHLLE